ncbi:MAG: hypothetical protein Ct9H300mP27_08320 [Chloroflexota bacterium]|nr:MAG: hypothetical protein Ct9H300mP27_08320 [Chloroflexota bacterium]
MAEKVAALDLLSKGRVEFGVGSSSDRLGTNAWGLDWERRQEITEEVLGQVARMMVEEPYRGYDGTDFSFPTRNILPQTATEAPSAFMVGLFSSRKHPEGCPVRNWSTIVFLYKFGYYTTVG